VGSDQSNTTFATPPAGQLDPINKVVQVNVSFDTRYVMIQHTRQDYLVLSEVEVIGQQIPVTQY
jgi:hypothetical protein